MNITGYLILSALLFTIGTVGVIVKKNVIAIFLCIELMLNAVNLSFVAFARFLNQTHGQIFVFFVMVVAAAEAAVGLAITVALYRNRKTLSVDDTDTLKW
jgi:NADH-quinone oxidoreductase subunit K